jgi:hypothetical protein
VSDTQRSGTLSPNVWTKVIWGWGIYTVQYQVFGTGAPFEVERYTPILTRFVLRAGDVFEFNPKGYGDVWFRSANGGSYQINPFVRRP